MQTFYIFLALVIFALLSWLFHYLANSVPLTDKEIKELALNRRFFKVVEHYGFEDYIVEINKEFKSKLKASGKFYDINEELSSFPSLTASLLKSKKHEWRIIGLSRGEKILVLWANKGNDNQSVSLNISVNEIIELAQNNKMDTIFDFHNHTNAVLEPSDTDIGASIYLGEIFTELKLNYLAFVVARGNYIQYAWWITDDLLPTDNYIKEIEEVNGNSKSINYNMYRDLRRKRNFKNTLLLENESSTNIFN